MLPHYRSISHLLSIYAIWHLVMFTVSRSVCWKLSATTPLHWSTLRLGPTPVYAGPQDSQWWWWWWWWFLFVFLPDLWYFWLCCISVVPSVAAMLRAVLGDCWLEWWSASAYLPASGDPDTAKATSQWERVNSSKGRGNVFMSTKFPRDHRISLVSPSNYNAG